MRRLSYCVLFPLIACTVDRRTVAPAADEITVTATSTMGYGCLVPPFVLAETVSGDGACGTESSAYILGDTTTAPDPAAGPPGRYRLIGRWAPARSTWSAWASARGEPIGEGAPPDSIDYRVLVVRDWCVEWPSVPPAYRDVSDLAPAAAPWRTRVCRRSDASP